MSIIHENWKYHNVVIMQKYLFDILLGKIPHTYIIVYKNPLIN